MGEETTSAGGRISVVTPTEGGAVTVSAALELPGVGTQQVQARTEVPGLPAAPDAGELTAALAGAATPLAEVVGVDADSAAEVGDAVIIVDPIAEVYAAADAAADEFESASGATVPRARLSGGVDPIPGQQARV